jgi:hypothetical protein
MCKYLAECWTKPSDDPLVIEIGFPGFPNGIQVFAKDGKMDRATVAIEVTEDFEESAAPLRGLLSRFYGTGESVEAGITALRSIPEVKILAVDRN